MSKLMISWFDQFPEYNGRKIEIRGKDGYFCATDMTACLNQTFSDWRRTKFATRLIARLAENLRLPVDYGDSRTQNQTPLIDFIPGRGQKMWIHPALAMSYAMSNPEFQADVNVWIYELMTIGTVNPHVLKWTQDEIERGLKFNRDDIDELYSR
jgi:hypothetical protein